MSFIPYITIYIIIIQYIQYILFNYMFVAVTLNIHISLNWAELVVHVFRNCRLFTSLTVWRIFLVCRVWCYVVWLVLRCFFLFGSCGELNFALLWILAFVFWSCSARDILLFISMLSFDFLVSNTTVTLYIYI